ncbi:MAG: LTA synthase family protein [Lachnospiraceae bacterium]|nr:LTA synthase family protein [Lachnospiraceae bacterium]
MQLVGMLVLFAGAGVALDWFGRKVRKDSVTVREAGSDKVTGKDTAGENRQRHWIVVCARLLGCGCICAAIFLYTDHFLGERYVIDAIEPLVPETDRYVLYRFLQNSSLSTINVERVEESYDFLLSKEPPKEAVNGEDYPNVIVIMNESWWNTDNIQTDRITFSQDPMGSYKELADRCVTGYQTSVVFGGGTVTPEIEFLTGLNAKYYRADSAYEQMQGRKVPSLVDYFNGLDYETVAIHPYYGSFYGRDVAYAIMGFDQVIFEEDMQYRDIYTRYISDESMAKQIIAEIEEESNGPKFIWTLSIGNHRRTLNYSVKSVTNYDYPISVTVNGVKLSKEDYDILVNYANGIYLANQAFSQLVEYFTSVEQPTVLLMFGDHCPNFSAEVLEALELGEENGDGEKAERLYSTPVIAWSNFS